MRMIIEILIDWNCEDFIIYFKCSCLLYTWWVCIIKVKELVVDHLPVIDRLLEKREKWGFQNEKGFLKILVFTFLW